MRPLHARILSAIAVLAVAIPAAGHAVRERVKAKAAQAELETMVEQLTPVATSAAAGQRRVTLNGAPIFFDKHTERGTLDEVMARINGACASGERDLAFGEAMPAEDGTSHPIRLERIAVAESEGGVNASLCIFAGDIADPSLVGTSREPTHRVRYTLAFDRGDGTVSVTSVVNASEMALATMFPATGDAPGNDLEGVARPADARRTHTAIVGAGEHSVRIYETVHPVEEAVAGYDGAMATLGYATTGTLADARMYRKNGRSYLASFQPTVAGGTRIALAPFEPPGASN